MTSRRINLWLLILAMAIACQAGSGSTAQASCGDYLIGHDHGHVRSMHVPETSFASKQGEWPASTPRPLRQTPCNGLDCQKVPAEPLSPMPTKIVPTDHERLGCLNAELSPVIERESVCWIAQPETLSCGYPLLIEHPPRA
jgi:hypothetical protein